MNHTYRASASSSEQSRGYNVTLKSWKYISPGSNNKSENLSKHTHAQYTSYIILITRNQLHKNMRKSL